MKTITIDSSGIVQCDQELTDQEKVAVGDYLFDDSQTDNQGQIIYYTGITEENSLEDFNLIQAINQAIKAD